MRSFAIEDPGSPDPPLYATLFGTDARPQLLAQSNAANAQNYINFMTSVRQSKRLFSSGINVLLLNEVKGRMFDFILSTVL